MINLRRSHAALAGLATMALTGGVGAAAHADPPGADEFDVSFSNVSQDLCPFPVRIDSVARGYRVIHIRSNGSGSLRLHSRETDTFSTGSGNTLRRLKGDPFTVNLEGEFDTQGNPRFIQGTGVLVKVPISRGVTFMAAGRLDVLHYQLDFPFVPTDGGMRNQAAFCAYLNPNR